jgi:hypothetical protein
MADNRFTSPSGPDPEVHGMVVLRPLRRLTEFKPEAGWRSRGRRRLGGSRAGRR